MNTFKKLAIAAGLCAAGFTSHTVAQTTDALHTIQVFPVVVDTASFTQRFTFRNPNGTTLTVSPTYFPGVGTAQASAITCPSFNVSANRSVTFSSLRAMCPALAAGSNFGFLYTYETNPTNMPYAAFSRVANPQGNGFSVEAFSAQTFTSADSVVSGVRRLAASGGAPAFQTNCFVANMNDYTPPGGTPPTTTVIVRVYNSAGTQLGSSTNFAMVPGKLNRLLDVFDVVGAPAGDYDNATVTFEESGTGEPGYMAFCTVQDNTSFGADFRIAKQELGYSDIDPGFHRGPQDDSAMRDTELSTDVAIPGSTTRTFSIPASVVNNAHVMYFRHPDWVSCEIINPTTGVRALGAYGLEMRLSRNGTVIAGGDELQAFGEIYLGDKTDVGNGVNTRYVIEVESTATNAGSVRPYRIHCTSGSGHTGGEILIYNGSDKF